MVLGYAMHDDLACVMPMPISNYNVMLLCHQHAWHGHADALERHGSYVLGKHIHYDSLKSFDMVKYVFTSFTLCIRPYCWPSALSTPTFC